MFSFQTLIQNPFDIHFEFGKCLERQGTVYSENDFTALACNTSAKVWGCHLHGISGRHHHCSDTTGASAEGGTMSPLPLPFAPAPALGQKLKERDSPGFFPCQDGPRQNSSMYEAGLLQHAYALVQYRCLLTANNDNK